MLYNKNENIAEHSTTVPVYVISQRILFGSREITQGGGEILLKVSSNVSAKFCVVISSKPQHKFWVIW